MAVKYRNLERSIPFMDLFRFQNLQNIEESEVNCHIFF